MTKQEKARKKELNKHFKELAKAYEKYKGGANEEDGFYLNGRKYKVFESEPQPKSKVIELRRKKEV